MDSRRRDSKARLEIACAPGLRPYSKRPTFYATSSARYLIVALEHATRKFAFSNSPSVHHLAKSRLPKLRDGPLSYLRTHYKKCTQTKTEPTDGTSFRTVDVGVCILETKQNRVACNRDKGYKAAGREREKGDIRVDVNKLHSGASTALTILETLGSVG